MADAVADVRAALDRTVAARTARITFSLDMSWPPQPSFPSPDRGPIRRLLVRTGKALGKAIGRGLWRLATRRFDPGRLTSEGVIDLANRRFMVDYGHYAVLQVGAQKWSGLSGRPIDTLPAEPARRVESPLWLLDLLAAITTATHNGTEEIAGQHWRRVVATANLAEASAARPEGLPSPAQDRFEDLLGLPIDIWLDDSYVRRVRFVTEHRTTTITMSDFGTDVEQLDWRALPIFRSP